jgi:hypothetical protein
MDKKKFNEYEYKNKNISITSFALFKNSVYYTK